MKPGFTGFQIDRLPGADHHPDLQVDNAVLPERRDRREQVTAAHAALEEAHVFEDVMQLVDVVREDVASVCDARHARHVIEIIEAAYRSAETGRAQELETTFDLDVGEVPARSV